MGVTVVRSSNRIGDDVPVSIFCFVVTSRLGVSLSQKRLKVGSTATHVLRVCGNQHAPTAALRNLVVRVMICQVRQHGIGCTKSEPVRGYSCEDLIRQSRECFRCLYTGTKGSDVILFAPYSGFFVACIMCREGLKVMSWAVIFVGYFSPHLTTRTLKMDEAGSAP